MHVPRRVIRPQSTLTEWVAGAKIPTRHGEFETHVFRSALGAQASPDELPQEHVALVFGDVRGRDDVLVRVHLTIPGAGGERLFGNVVVLLLRWDEDLEGAGPPRLRVAGFDEEG